MLRKLCMPQISSTLTDNIMQEVSRFEPTALSASKPIIPWVIGIAGALLITLMLGIGGQCLAHFQKPYNLDAQSERSVELVDAQIVQDLQVESDNRNQLRNRDALGGRNSGDGGNVNQVLGDQGDYTQWRLPEGAKRRLGKGMFTDMQLTQDGNRLAIASSTGIWIYDVETGKETALLTKNTDLTGLVAFSPDGKTLASTGFNNMCSIWDVENQKLLLTFKLPDYWIRSIRFLDDGKTLVGEGFIDKKSYGLRKVLMWAIPKIWMWDSTTGKLLNSYTTELPKFNPLIDADMSVPFQGFTNGSRVLFAYENKENQTIVKDGNIDKEIVTIPSTGQEKRDFVFSADGKRLAIAYDRSVHFWDIGIDSGNQKATFPIHIANFSGNPSILSFSKDGRILAAAGVRGITVWNVETRSHITTFLNVKGGLWEFVLSADGSTVVTMDHEGAVDFWSVSNDKHERTLTTGYTGRFTGLTFAHDGKTVATTARGKIYLWNTDTGTEKLHLQVPMYSAIKNIYSEWHSRGAVVPAERGSDIISLAFSKNNETLNTFNISGKIGSLDVNTGEYRISNILAGVDTVKSLPVYSNLLAKGIITNPLPRTSNIYHLYVTSFENTSVFIPEATFSSNGELLASKNREGAVEVWDLTIPRRLYTLAVQNPNVRSNPAIITEFAEDGDVLVIREGQDIHLSDVNSGETLAKYRVPEKKPNIIDNFMSMFGDDPVIQKIDTVALAQGEKTILAANEDETIYLWDIMTRERILTIKGHADAVCKLAFTIGGTILASGDVGGVIHLWKIPTGEKLATFKPYTSPITQLVFSPDGRTLASTNLHSHFAGSILLWNVPTE